MTEHNQKETAKLASGAKWVIRQLLLEVEARDTEIELYDAVPGGYVVFYKLLSGKDAVVSEFANILNIKKQGHRLEVRHE